MGSSSGPSRTTTTTEPPKFIQPYLQDAAQRSFNLFSTGGREFFPNSTVVPFSPQTQQALDLTQQRAMTGGAATNAAQGYAQRTIGGDFLSSNPYASGSEANPFAEGGANPFLDATFNRAADQVQNRLQSSFAGAGRNIGAARAPAALELNDLAERIYGGAYESDATRRQAAYEATQGRRFAGLENERKAMDFAAGLSPSLDATDYADLGALQGVGGQYEDLYGRQLQDQIDRFEFAQNRPYQNLDEYIARIQGAFPGQSQTATTRGPGVNRAAGALGGAATGASIGSVVPGIGTGIGAGIGALAGYFL